MLALFSVHTRKDWRMFVGPLIATRPDNKPISPSLLITKRGLHQDWISSADGTKGRKSLMGHAGVGHARSPMWRLTRAASFAASGIRIPLITRADTIPVRLSPVPPIGSITSTHGSEISERVTTFRGDVINTAFNQQVASRVFHSYRPVL